MTPVNPPLELVLEAGALLLERVRDHLVKQFRPFVKRRLAAQREQRREVERRPG